MKHAIITIICVMLLGCEKKCHRPTSYAFQIPLSITPASSLLEVGDTLHIRMHVDNDSIYDRIGDEIVKVTDFDPNASFFLARIDTYPEGEGLKLNDVIISDEYEAPYVPFSKRNSGGHLFLDIIQENNYSTIAFDIVLKEGGNYMLLVKSSIYKNSKNIIIEGRCRQSEHSVFVNWIINDRDIHEQILNDTLKNNIESYWSKSFGSRPRTDSYFFRVE